MGYLDFVTVWIMDTASGANHPQLRNCREYPDSGVTVKPIEYKNLPAGYTGISTVEELYAIRYNLSGKYILTTDLDLTEATKTGGAWNTGYGWNPIGRSTDYAFTGVFDGNGHCIIGLQSQYGYGSLFGYINNGTVKNLGLKNVNISNNNSSCQLGGIAASVTGGTISNCFVTGNVNTSASYSAAGGLIGSINVTTSSKLLIENCYNKASVNGAYAGGIVGRADGNPQSISNYATIKQCVNIGTISGSNSTGAIIGRTSESTYYTDANLAPSQCYYLNSSSLNASKFSSAQYPSTVLTADQLKNQLSMGYLDFTNTWFLDTDTGIMHPQLIRCPESKCLSISIASQPKKTIYLHHDTIDLSGLTISAKFEGIAKNITKKVSADMVSGFNAEKLGKQKLTISYYGQTVEFEVEVKARPVQAIALDKTSISLDITKSVKLSASLTPTNATDRSVSWSSSDNTIVTVNENGTITALKLGTARITAHSSNSLTAECTVRVLQPASSIKVSQPNATIIKGQSLQVSAVMEPSNTTDTYSWSSSNSSVVSVDKNGKITANKAGTAIITASTSRGLTATITVKVIVPAKSIVLNCKTLSLNIGASERLQPTLSPADSTDSISWSSSDPAIATVSTNGTVTAKAKGTAIITAKTESGETTNCNITVLVPAQSIKLNKTAETVEIGATTPLTAVMYPENTTDSVIWSSSNTAIATVSNTGLVETKAVGAVTITAKSTSGKTASCTITVVRSVTGISLNKTERFVRFIGSIFTLTPTITPKDATNTSVLWSSSNNSVAKVDGSGVVTIVANGDAVITVKTIDGEKTATCSIHVETFMPGDVDLDASVTSSDARLALRRAVGLENYKEDSTEYLAADVDMDGSVTAADARLILRAAVGLEKLSSFSHHHHLGKETKIPPTCEKNGSVKAYCDICREEIVTILPATGHTWISKYGVKGKVCSVCGKTECQANGHTWKDATCTTAKTCTICGVTEGKANGHVWDSGKVEKEASCTISGLMKYTCTVCKTTKTETIKATGHKWTAASCTEAKKCSVCGAKDGKPLGHSYDKGVVKKAATCTTKGSKVFTCTRCKTQKTEDIPALGHSWTPATCTKAQYCTRCKTTQGKALGHSYTSTVIAPTPSSQGYTLHTCSRCGTSYKDNYTNYQAPSVTYVCNTRTMVFHRSSCSSVKKMSSSNKWVANGYTRSQLINRGYSPCKNCKP